MKLIKIIAATLLLLIIFVTGYFLYFKSTHQPVYKGELTLDGLTDKVEVYYGEYGIPHIYAANESDLYYALGYIQAQDRLWQLDLIRRIGSGRLAELFGEELITTDKFFRTLGIHKYALESAANLRNNNSRIRRYSQAYIDGINMFISISPKPIEHTILNIDIEPFQLENIYHLSGFMAFSFANAHKTDPFLTELASRLDFSYLIDLPIYHNSSDLNNPKYFGNSNSLTSAVNHALKKVSAPLFIGSNSWVLSPEKTTSGKTILVNDPHIGFSQPSVWFEAHLVSPEVEYYGYFLPGSPFPPILHNEYMSNGITMFENDDIDFYVEKIDPDDSSRYLYKGLWETISRTSEIIKVKDRDAIEFTVSTTKHGPIISDVINDSSLNQIVSMYWTFTHHEEKVLSATYQFTKAKNIEDIQSACSLIHGPGLNVMYGDSSGNIAWWASGKLIKRADERSSKFFRNGFDGLSDPDSSYDFLYNPQIINPSSNYIYTANQQPDSVNGIYYSGYYLPKDRADQIKYNLDSKEKFSVDDMKNMLMENQSTLTNNVRDTLLMIIDKDIQSDFRQMLLEWNGRFDQGEIAPLIFQKWQHEILKMALKDEMGDNLWESFLSTHLIKRTYESIILNKSSKWWDNIETSDIETREIIVRQAFEKSYNELIKTWGSDLSKWRWGNAHTLTHKHTFGKNLLMGKIFNVGPFSVSGTNEVINNLGFTASDGPIYETIFGPSTRRIIDFSDVRNNSWSILPTGQSGNPFSPYYDDQAELYNKGQFRKMLMNHDEIKQSTNLLVLFPKN